MKETRPTIYFAVYVNVNGKTPQRAKMILAEMYHSFNEKKEEQPYYERFFIIPIKDHDSKIELLYPSPFLTQEQADQLYQKYYDKYQEIIQEIQNL